MNVVAKLRYLRIAPRKVRLVLGLIRGKSIQAAEAQLLNLPKRSSQPILKLLKSAQANAEHNFKLDPKVLTVTRAFADEGPKLKRYQPRAMGRAFVIQKRTSHVTVVLTAPGKPTQTEHPPKAETKKVATAPKAPATVTKQSAKKGVKTTGKAPVRRLAHPGEKAKVDSK